MARILTVDDALTIRSALQLILKHHRHDVFVFENGKEALNFARQKSVDPTITDLNMPEMNVMNLISNLKFLPAYEYTPILVMTTETADYKKKKARSIGATGWIAKPFTEERILKALDEALP